MGEAGKADGFSQMCTIGECCSLLDKEMQYYLQVLWWLQDREE